MENQCTKIKKKGTMTEEQYDQFREVIRKKGYKQYNHPGTIHNESWYFYKGFAHTEDEDGEQSPGYQVIFLIWDHRNHRVETPVPEDLTMGITPLILTQSHEWERIDLEITDDKLTNVDSVEQFAHDFYFNFLLIHNL